MATPQRLVTFEDWTQRRLIASLGTNAGSQAVPFQSWRHFKEAFAPELVERAFSESKIPVTRCLDPFGGSGTTALACQFLGVHPITVEVNPFLADLIRSKLAIYDSDALARDFGRIVTSAIAAKGDVDEVFGHAPATFVEPGVKYRWIFDYEVAERIAAWLQAVRQLSNVLHRRFFKVLLGGILVDVSNVVISGKGRRYRGNWESRRKDGRRVDQLFCDFVETAVYEVHSHVRRPCTSSEVFCADSRKLLQQRVPCDLAVFSPPYPNSFDYTDVYNVELWTLGYLKSVKSNRLLRASTLSSHVQTAREFAPPPAGSRKLGTALKRLKEKRSELWNRNLPEMVGAYFTDLLAVLSGIHRSLATRGRVWIVVGESRYGHVQIETAEILVQLLPANGWRVEGLEDCRSMRSSPQHGGRTELAETLLILSHR
jgi:hypothetical protein